MSRFHLFLAYSCVKKTYKYFTLAYNFFRTPFQEPVVRWNFFGLSCTGLLTPKPNKLQNPPSSQLEIFAFTKIWTLRSHIIRSKVPWFYSSLHILHSSCLMLNCLSYIIRSLGDAKYNYRYNLAFGSRKVTMVGSFRIFSVTFGV